MGHIVSAQHNFKLTKNISKFIYNIQLTSPITNGGDASAYWFINTDFTTRPIKLLVDTGAQVTLISNDVLLPEVKLSKNVINLTGITGLQNSLITKGALRGGFIAADGTRWPAEVHVIDRSVLDTYDGYLGFDFMFAYAAIINLGNNSIELFSKNEDINENSNIDNDSDASSLNNDEIINKKSYANLTQNINKPKCIVNQVEKISQFKQKNEYDLAQNMNEPKCNENDDEGNSQIIECNNKILTKNVNQSTIANMLTSHIEENENKENIELLKYVENRTILDSDGEIEKIKKIQNNGLKFNNKNVIAYVRHFSTKKVHISNEIENKKYKVFTTSELKRNELIIQNLKLDHLNEMQRQAIYNLVSKYDRQFFVEGDTLSRTDLVQHKIVLKPNTGIIAIKQFRLPEISKEKVVKETKELYNQQIIRDSTSPFNAPAFVVPKKNEMGQRIGDRLVHDFRKLNEATMLQNYPVPLIQELIDDFAQSNFFTKLDIERAFNQISMEEPSKKYTAFTVAHRKYEFNAMANGLNGAPATMQKALTVMLADLLDKGVSVYFDDISIHTKTYDQHLILLEEIFKRLKKHNLQLKVKKCEFFAEKIHYLGFVISPGMVEPNPSKTKIISNFPIPKNRKQVQSFLGMCNYFRQFIRNYAKISRPLSRLTSPTIKFELNEDAMKSFESLKKIMAEKVTLTIVDFSKEFTLATDASDFAIGAVLTQKTENGERPIYFFSRVLTQHEINYATHEKELLAIVAAIEEFETYLKGRKFTVKTDSQCLVYLFSNPHRNKRLVRQAINILDANFDILYQPGKLNVVADALSRITFTDTDIWQKVPIKEFIQRHVQSIKAIRKIFRQSPIAFSTENRLSKLASYVYIENSKTKKTQQYEQTYTIISIADKNSMSKFMTVDQSKNTSAVQKISDLHSIIIVKSIPVKDNEIRGAIQIIQGHASSNNYKKIAIESDFTAKNLFLLKYFIQSIFSQEDMSVAIHINTIIELSDPNDIRQAMQMHHDLRLGGHAGIQRMKATMKQLYFWPAMDCDIKEYVLNCQICEKAKITKYTKMPMQITTTGSRPFEHIYIDHVGPISPPSNNGFNNIFVAICDLTKYSIAVPVKDLTSETTADVFIKSIILQFGFPEEVSHDGGKAFTSDLFRDLNKKLKLRDITTTPYNPRANIVERRNRSMSEYLKCYTQTKPHVWDELLQYATFAYNITVNTTTGYSPFELVYGRRVTLPDSLKRKSPIYNYDNYSNLIKKEFTDAWLMAQEAVNKSKLNNKKYYDKKLNMINIKIGDKIFVKKIIRDGKFDLVWKGPFVVVEMGEKYIIYMEGKKKKSIGIDYVKLAKTANQIQFVNDIPAFQQNFIRRINILFKQNE